MAFDSRQYEWADLEIQLGGKTLVAVTGVKYKRKVEREAYFGKGRKPLSLQTGNETVEGELSIGKSELDSLITRTNKKLLHTSFSLVVCYGNQSEGVPMTTDIIEGLKISEYEQGLKQGDKAMEITLPFMALNVLEQA